MLGGYWLKALRVDLDRGAVWTEELDESVARAFIGGAGVAALFLSREVGESVGPRSPANLLVFATGPFQAMKLPGAAKFSICTRSPLTGTFTDSAAGGGFGIALKRTGYDFLLISGRSREPVYLCVTSDSASILPAGDLWGRDSIETFESLSKRHGGASVAAIGPAGENGIAMSCVYVDGYSAAGRGGTGCVMGDKRLKAVVVSGNLDPPVSDRAQVESYEKKFRKSIAETAAGFREAGTVGGLASGEESGNLPLRNWSQVGWKEGAAKIGYPGYATLNNKLHPCKYCSLSCHRLANVSFPDGYSYKGPSPEYETLAMLGASCLVDDLESLVKANDECNRAGLDTMSAGGCAAFAMEALEKGHTNGLFPAYDLSWGNGAGLREFIGEMVARKGFGGLFSDGIVPAAAKFLPEASRYAQHVKGQDIPAHDPRVYYNLGLSYATGNRGACHMRAYSQISTMGALLPEVGIDVAPAPDTLEGAARVVKAYQDFTAFYNSCVLCQFMIWGGFGLGDMTDCLNAVTGWRLTPHDVMECGERAFTLQRVLNNRWGFSKKDDRLPERFFMASSSGARAGKAPDRERFSAELAELYHLRGWDEDGFVRGATLVRLRMNKWM
ncbi:MAG: aldehyde ferredoxin oxidoreductase family protein [Rectinemataceae bacterium]